MGAAIQASDEGLKLVDAKRRLLGWNKTDPNWQEKANVGEAGLKRFWTQKRIKTQNFKNICAALDLDWEDIAKNEEHCAIEMRCKEASDRISKLHQFQLNLNSEELYKESQNKDLLEETLCRGILNQLVEDIIRNLKEAPSDSSMLQRATMLTHKISATIEAEYGYPGDSCSCISVEVRDQPGVLSRVAGEFADRNINITQTIQKRKGENCIIFFYCLEKDYTLLEELIIGISKKQLVINVNIERKLSSL